MDPTKTNAMLASFRQGNFHWHIDGATQEVPQKATLLTARAVDPAGGDTEFAKTYAAYESLSDAERSEIAGLQVIHSFTHAQSLANPDATDEQRASWDRVAARVHPLVWTRRSGRRSLLLGATAAEVVGWPTPEAGLARPPLGLGDPAPVHPAPFVACRGPGDLGQHRDVAPRLAFRAVIGASHAPHHASTRRAGNDGLNLATGARAG
jgi:Taurine catabolism dioxygenase TauD, TfdA family